jgi:23S rRNA pseudouridine2605 synthase
LKENKIRLQKIISQNGIASRRKAEEMITKGVVKINGRVASLGDKADPKKDNVTVFGRSIGTKEKTIYLALYKPRGYICTLKDDRERKCVVDLVKDVGVRLYPVGRLDKDSEGLLLMTNDGSFANSVMHPSKHIAKTYRVTIASKVTEEQIAKLEEGIVIDGKKTLPCRVRTVTKEENRTVLEIILYQGLNRQIRKMCDSLELNVKRLKRVQIGDIKLGMLSPGKYRELNEKDIKGLLR